MSGEFTDLFAVAACGAAVAVAEAVTIPLLRRAVIIDVPDHRAAADLAGAVVVVTYLRSPALLARRLIRAEAS